MAFNQQHAKVLIVGAGPSGLMMAAQLLRHGVQPVIIDSRLGPTDQSKALAVQARTLEIYRQMGIVDKALANGRPAGGVAFNANGKTVASLSFEDTGQGQTPFPFILFYQQSKNERLLLDYLTLNCCPVYWNTTLLSLQQNNHIVTAKIKESDTEHTLTCNWLIGADGARSMVRKQLNIAFKGDTYAHKFYLADVQLENQFNGNVQLFVERNSLAAFFPMPEQDCYRIVGDIPNHLAEREELTIDDVLPHLEKITGFNIKVAHTKWFTMYKLHHRMAEDFRQQQCFLIGDAAHIHSPVGGQGMNTGLQDAYNLAWKLAGVLNGQLKPEILNSYAAERMPVAKELLNTTDRAFNMITGSNWWAVLFKKWIMPKALKFAWGNQQIRELFFKRVSQISINYRESRINLHLSQLSTTKAGDRLPYVKIFDEKKQQETDLHAWCGKPGFTLIVLAKLKEIDVFTLAKWASQKYNGVLNLFYLPPSAKNTAVYNLFDIKDGHKKAIIIRPDMYIGYINDVVDIDMMDNYLVNVVGVVGE